MEIFDLGIAWNWQPDNDFVEELNEQTLKAGLRPYLLHAYNFYVSLKDIVDDRIAFCFFLDRASEDDATFKGLAGFLKKKHITFINHPDMAERSADRLAMHLDFIKQEISVPHTVILSPQDDVQNLELKTRNLPKPFVLKPANATGAEETILNIHSLDELVSLKEQKNTVTYLAQEKVLPQDLEGKPAWFRVFYCYQDIIPCWWHPENHIYTPLTKNEMRRFDLSALWELAQKIYQICQLNFFSTEIARKKDGTFVVVDYVNDQCDMRKQSAYKDGVPVDIVDRIVKNIILHIRQGDSQANNP